MALTIEDFRTGKVKVCEKFSTIRDEVFDEVERRLFNSGELPVLLRRRPLGELETKEYGPGKTDPDSFQKAFGDALADARQQPPEFDIWALGWILHADPLNSGTEGVWLCAWIYERGQACSFRVGQQVKGSLLQAMRGRMKRIGFPTFMEMQLPLMDPNNGPALPLGDLSPQALIAGLQARCTHADATRRLIAAGPELDVVLTRVAQENPCELSRLLVASVAQSRELARDPGAWDRQTKLDSTAAFDSHPALGGFWFFVVGAAAIPESMRRQIRERRAADTQRGADLTEAASDAEFLSYLAGVREAAPGLLHGRDMEDLNLALMRARRESLDLFWALTTRWERDRLGCDETPESRGTLSSTLQHYADAARGLAVFDEPRTRFADESEEPSDDDGVPGFATFRLNGSPVDVAIRFRDDTEAVHGAINESLREQGVEERFFYLPSTDDQLGLLYEKPSALLALRDRGLIPSRKPSRWSRPALRLVERVYFPEGEVSGAVCDANGVTLACFQGPLIRFEGGSLERAWSHDVGMARPRFLSNGITIGETMRRSAIAVSDDGRVLWKSAGTALGSGGSNVLIRDDDAIEMVAAASGLRAWRRAVGAKASAVLAGGRLMILDGGAVSVADVDQDGRASGWRTLALDWPADMVAFSVAEEIFTSAVEGLSVLDFAAGTVTKRWTASAMGESRQIAVADDAIYLSGPGASVSARERRTGVELWRSVPAHSAQSLTVWGDFLVVEFGTGMVLLDRATGAAVKTYEAEPAAGWPMVYGERLVVPVGSFLNVFDYC